MLNQRPGEPVAAAPRTASPSGQFGTLSAPALASLVAAVDLSGTGKYGLPMRFFFLFYFLFFFTIMSTMLYFFPGAAGTPGEHFLQVKAWTHGAIDGDALIKRITGIA